MEWLDDEAIRSNNKVEDVLLFIGDEENVNRPYTASVSLRSWTSFSSIYIL